MLFILCFPLESFNTLLLYFTELDAEFCKFYQQICVYHFVARYEAHFLPGFYLSVVVSLLSLLVCRIFFAHRLYLSSCGFFLLPFPVQCSLVFSENTLLKRRFIWKLMLILETHSYSYEYIYIYIFMKRVCVYISGSWVLEPVSPSAVQIPVVCLWLPVIKL